MRKPPPLTDVQLEILDLIWTHSECTISFLWNELKKKRPVARNTVLTLVNRLVERDILTRKRRGRAFVYQSRVKRRSAQKHRLQKTLDHLFQGSAEDLVKALLGNDLVKPDEIPRLKKLLAEAEKRLSRRTRS